MSRSDYELLSARGGASGRAPDSAQSSESLPETLGRETSDRTPSLTKSKLCGVKFLTENFRGVIMRNTP